MEHKNNFDLLRLFAACQVMFMHVGGHLKLPLGTPVTDFLWMFPGVPVFFVISGFLVTNSALRSQSLRSFFWNRGLRIYPALAVNILVLDFVMYLSGGSVVGIRTVPYMMTYIATASSWIAWKVTGFGPYVGEHPQLPFYPSGVLWTLTVEMSFYLVVPVIAAIAIKNLRAGLLALAILMTGSVYLASYFSADFINQHPLLNILCPAYLWVFGIGMVLSLTWDKVSWLFEGKAYIWLPLYIATGLYGAQSNWFPAGIDFHTAVGPVVVARTVFLGLTVISCAYTLKGLVSILRGLDLSYGVYLWHMLFVTLFLAYGVTGHWWLWLAVPACAGGAAYISRRCFELPALKLKNRSIRDVVKSNRFRVRPIALNRTDDVRANANPLDI